MRFFGVAGNLLLVARPWPKDGVSKAIYFDNLSA